MPSARFRTRVLIELAPVFGKQGLDHLKARFVELSKMPTRELRKEEREVIGWATSGPIYADEFAARQRDSIIRLALEEIADAQGDVDAYIAQQSPKTRSVPGVAAEIAQRLLAAGRPEEAWTAINAIDEDRPGWIPVEWEMTRLEVMEALGRSDEAQAFRWQCFESTLDSGHLRTYLQCLPDFDDVEAEERAMAHVLQYPDVHHSLAFLVSWPAVDIAAALVLQRRGELDGDHYELLTPAADALSAKHPMAATVLLRAMIDFALRNGRSTRYRHAAGHLVACSNLAAVIANFGPLEPHDSYLARLRDEHGRKAAFWSHFR